MLTNGEPVPELAFVCHASKAREKGKKMVARMQEEIPRQQVQSHTMSLQYRGTLVVEYLWLG